MNPITAGKIKWNSASTWDELTRAQLLIWAEFCYRFADATGEIAMQAMGDFQQRLAFSELNWRQRFFIAKHTNTIQRAQIGWSFDFLKKKNTLSKILLPTVRVWFTKYYGPSEKMKNVIVEEFALADMCYLNYMKTRLPEHLDKLIAVIYREKKKDTLVTGDSREPFNEFTVAARAKKISRMSGRMKQAILLQYMGIRNVMVEKHPNVFNDKVQSRVRNFGWAGVVDDLSGSKLGTHEAVQRQPIWNILFVMEKNEIRRQEVENKK